MIDYLKERKIPAILAIVMLLIGSVIYFATGAYESMGSDKKMEFKSNLSSDDISLLSNLELKAAYTPEGNVKIFALARNNDLARFKASEGQAIPEAQSIVIGSAEAGMMKEEKLFSKPGDRLNGLFGIDTTVGGVLEPTGTFADDFHFLDSYQYDKLEGEQGVLFIKFKDAATPKLFYIYDVQNASPAKLELAEGNMNLYYKHVIGNKIYYPVIIGAKEAKMMREEKLFSTTGDIIQGFFGKDVIVAGVLEETNTGLDMAHVVEKDFFDNTINVEVV